MKNGKGDYAEDTPGMHRMGSNKVGGTMHKGDGGIEYGTDGHSMLPSEKGHPSGKGWGGANVTGTRLKGKLG